MGSSLSDLRRTYLLGLARIFLLLLLSQVVVLVLRSDQGNVFETVNIAGRQRMLSQRISRAGTDLANGAQTRAQLIESVEEFEAAHRDLVAHEVNTEGIDAKYERLAPIANTLVSTSRELLELPSADEEAGRTRAALISRAAEEFLPQMNAIVKDYELVGKSQLSIFDTVSLTLGICLILVLVIEAVFVFEPMLRTLRGRIVDLEETRAEARHTAAELRASEARYALAVEGSRDGLWDWDLVEDRIHFAPRWCELLGLDPDEISDGPEEWFSRVEPEDLAHFRTRLAMHIEGETDRLDVPLEMLHADGTSRAMLCRASASRDESGRAFRLAGSLADITELRQAQEELRQMAQHDQLTGLPNRRLFTERLREAVERNREDGRYRIAVLFFDFDRFKIVNDSLGHDVGDLLLLSITERFRGVIREHDIAARFGGDEFVLLLDKIENGAETERICERLLEVFAQPHQLGGHEVVSTASIGVVCDDVGERSAEELIRDADAAMYRAKSLGKARFQMFDEDMRAAALNRLTTEQELRGAVKRQELSLVYQPIIDNRTGITAGFESLVRWQHPERGLVRPDEFLPIAEETGLIVEIGEIVMNASCRQLAEWRRTGLVDEDFFVNVNLSRRQLVHPGLVESLKDAVDRAGIPAQNIKLEITETVVMDDRVDMIPIMKEIRDCGFPLAIDDFGTGYSSLSCLHEFPIDVLKIDRSFTVNMETRREFAAVLQAIATLAHHLRLSVVVEGVENTAQLAQLQAMDCEFAQGYLFSKPLAAAAARELLEKQDSERSPKLMA